MTGCCLHWMGLNIGFSFELFGPKVFVLKCELWYYIMSLFVFTNFIFFTFVPLLIWICMYLVNFIDKSRCTIEPSSIFFFHGEDSNTACISNGFQLWWSFHASDLAFWWQSKGNFDPVTHPYMLLSKLFSNISTVI